jgi:hypothetical protein
LSWQGYASSDVVDVELFLHFDLSRVRKFARLVLPLDLLCAGCFFLRRLSLLLLKLGLLRFLLRLNEFSLLAGGLTLDLLDTASGVLRLFFLSFLAIFAFVSILSRSIYKRR